MHKRQRHDALLEIIRTESIASQGELAARLTDLGYSVTQASVSRDIVELGVTKRSGTYTMQETAGASVGFGSVGFDTAGDSLIVGRCASGLASAITVRIDSAKISDIVGTIAGDDTIFIAIKDGAAQSTVLEILREMFD